MIAASHNSHRNARVLGGESLKSVWHKSRPRLVVVYPGDSCRVELSCGKDVLWSGQWAFDVRIDGVPAVPTSQWDELCWVSDSDADYLELEIELSGGVRVQRHFMLARDDRFLLIGDAVLGTRPAAMQYRGSLPLCSGVTFRETSPAHQGVLMGRKPRAMVLPLALQEQSGDQCSGGGLEIRQSANAQALYAPLFLDLDRPRFKGATNGRASGRGIHFSRRLTVAESWTVQPADVAVGYRVAIGKKQWLIYRSLARPASRSVLGHNLKTEMLVARFDRKGEVETLIEIE
jgi:hypothetical protein